MKKILLGALIASTTLMAAGTASADLVISPSEFKPYVGLDYKYLSGFDSVGYDDQEGVEPLDGYVNVLGATFGVQLNDYVGIEASYGKGIDKIDGKSFTFTSDPSDEIAWTETQTVGKTKFEHISIGLTGQYPIAEQVYVKALVGAAWQRFETSGASATYTQGDFTETSSIDQKIHSNNEAVFLGKVGLGYQASKNSVFEINYTAEGDLDGLGLQYKYVF